MSVYERLTLLSLLSLFLLSPPPVCPCRGRAGVCSLIVTHLRVCSALVLSLREREAGRQPDRQPDRPSARQTSVTCVPTLLLLVDMLVSLLALQHRGGLKDPACKTYCEDERWRGFKTKENTKKKNAWHFGNIDTTCGTVPSGDPW